MTGGKKQSKMERGKENEEEDKSNSLGMTGTETSEMTTPQHTQLKLELLSDRIVKITIRITGIELIEFNEIE